MRFKRQSEMHFGNVSGKDIAKGMDIASIGTPIEPSEITLLRAALFGYDIKDESRGMTKVSTDHYEFVKFTFNDPTLSRIETTVAEQEIRQTATRGRTARTESNTIVFSSIPIPESDEFIGKTIIERFPDNLEELSTVFKNREEHYKRLTEMIGEVLNNEEYYQLEGFKLMYGFLMGNEDYKQTDLFKEEIDIYSGYDFIIQEDFNLLDQLK